jgi:hypothetical protein
MNQDIYNNPAALLDAAEDTLSRLELMLARHDEIARPPVYFSSVQAALNGLRDVVAKARSHSAPTVVWTNGMDTPDEHGFVALQVVEDMRTEWARGDVLDQQFAKRFAKRFAINDALASFTLNDDQRASVQMNCAQARFMSALLGGSASTPTWPAYRLTNDEIGRRLSSDAVPGALALGSAMTRGNTMIRPGVTLATVPALVLRLREQFRTQNAHVTDWGEE